MKWSELPLHPSPKTLRQFAGAWLVLFLAVGARQYLAHGRHAVGLVLGGLALLVGLLGLITRYSHCPFIMPRQGLTELIAA